MWSSIVTTAVGIAIGWRAVARDLLPQLHEGPPRTDAKGRLAYSVLTGLVFALLLLLCSGLGRILALTVGPPDLARHHHGEPPQCRDVVSLSSVESVEGARMRCGQRPSDSA